MRNVGILKQSFMVESIPKTGSQNNPNPNKPVDVHSVVNAIGKSVSSISI